MENFKIWLEARRLQLPVEALPKSELNKYIIKVNDIVQLGTETEHNGVITPKYGQVLEVKGGYVTVLNFATGDPVLIYIDDLDHIDPMDKTPEERAKIVETLKKLTKNGITPNLWIKLTKRQKQRKESNDRKKSKELEKRRNKLSLSVVNPDKSISASDVDRIKDILGNTDSKEEEPTANHVFDVPTRVFRSPLAGKIKSKDFF